MFERLRELRKISIHAPHARSDAEQADALAATYISIHAPHARSDVWLRRWSIKT